MDIKTIDELIEYFLEEKRKGMGFSEIRKQLVAKKLNDEKIKFIIGNIDNQILREEKIKHENQKARELILIGLFVTVIGLIITIGTYTGIIYLGNSFILAYGPIMGGLGILFAGFGKYRKL